MLIYELPVDSLYIYMRNTWVCISCRVRVSCVVLNNFFIDVSIFPRNRQHLLKTMVHFKTF